MTQNKTGTQQSPMADNLYFGDGQGGFRDLSVPSGIQSRNWGSATVEQLNNAEGHSWSWGATACDLDSIGVPELMSPAYGRSPNHLWLGSETTSSIQFANHSVASGYAFDQIVDWSDNESAKCWCKLNPTSEGCGLNVPQPRINANKLAMSFAGDTAATAAMAARRQQWRDRLR